MGKGVYVCGGGGGGKTYIWHFTDCDVLQLAVFEWHDPQCKKGKQMGGKSCSDHALHLFVSVWMHWALHFFIYIIFLYLLTNSVQCNVNCSVQHYL